MLEDHLDESRQRVRQRFDWAVTAKGPLQPGRDQVCHMEADQLNAAAGGQQRADALCDKRLKRLWRAGLQGGGNAAAKRRADEMRDKLGHDVLTAQECQQKAGPRLHCINIASKVATRFEPRAPLKAPPQSCRSTASRGSATGP